jgi:hypothetical protein
VARARQAGHYALAYWLLELRDYGSVLNGKPRLIDPAELPSALLAAVNKLADAESRLAAAAGAVSRIKAELATAEKELADRLAKGEATLRDELKDMGPANT